jgi:hypothetical protein
MSAPPSLHLMTSLTMRLSRRFSQARDAQHDRLKDLPDELNASTAKVNCSQAKALKSNSRQWTLEFSSRNSTISIHIAGCHTQRGLAAYVISESGRPSAMPTIIQEVVMATCWQRSNEKLLKSIVGLRSFEEAYVTHQLQLCIRFWPFGANTTKFFHCLAMNLTILHEIAWKWLCCNCMSEGNCVIQYLSEIPTSSKLGFCKPSRTYLTFEILNRMTWKYHV